MKEFWIKEQQKLDKFIQDNPVFYIYHKNGEPTGTRNIFCPALRKMKTVKRFIQTT